MPGPDGKPTFWEHALISAGGNMQTQPMLSSYWAAMDPRGTQAEITRRQWTDFQHTAVPVIKGLEDMTTYAGHQGVVGALETDARNQAKAAYGGLVENANRDAQSYGMAPANNGALERASKLGMASATVDGVNRANQYQQDLNRQITSGANLSTVKG